MLDTGFPQADAENDFLRARRRHVLAALARRLRHQHRGSDRLLTLGEVTGALGWRGERHLGLQTIRLDTIAGTLGHVFVANMTGNVVFLAFALAGAHGFSLPAVVVALAAFGAGALAGGGLGSRLGRHRGRLLSATAAAQALLLTAAVVIAALAQTPMPPGNRYGLIVVLATSMGAQNATAQRLDWWHCRTPDLAESARPADKARPGKAHA
jgi:hypothetical protein